MTHELNFNTREKSYLVITLNDERQTKLLLRTPNKKLNQEFKALSDMNPDDADIGEVYTVFAKILSHNRTGYRVDVEEVSDMDIDDIYAFFDEYKDFIEEVCSSKN